MSKVSLENLIKSYDGKSNVVKSINLTIKDGEFMVFVGPSGCGKSTILRMIAGLEDVSSGSIYIGERLVNNTLPKDRNISMVFQNYALYPHMSVRENIGFALKLRKVDKAIIREKIDRVSKILGLTDYLDRKPKNLSGGQRQRVALGRAIVRDPEVFLFDEPLSNLDAKLRVQMRSEIIKLHNRLKTTMVYVTHDQTEAMTMGDRIAVLNNGIIQQVDTPMNLYNRPNNRFVAGFIGSPSMNFINGTLNSNGEDLTFNSDIFNFTFNKKSKTIFDNRKVILGVRSEDIVLDPNGSEAEIEIVEPMGNETFIYYKYGESTLLSRRKGDNIPKIGDLEKISVVKEKIHIFDFETEEVILLG
ncbi:MAG: glycerol-3-phosphate ABC transporter ATP-binding protein [Candidatus Cloacimonadota bacterium]|nr:MAG: glycerol-3-phosphate ABC transporter ATP-binding protein [Candidatus Cloacimonadota bacterium]PIE77502.1 MAG: glycerol-3-phosphate ABC transporter ATP-binding protein [Candidatus Delongbacteria bacterium]